MKSKLLRTLAYAIGQPIIETGRGIELAGKGMRYVSDKTVVGGVATQFYGSHVKSKIADKADAAQSHEIEKAAELESAKHSEVLDSLMSQAKHIEESRDELLKQVEDSLAESLNDIQASIEAERDRHAKATTKNASIEVTAEIVTEEPGMVPATA